VVYALSSLKETAASRSAATTTVGTMEGENEIQDDLPYMPSSTITSNLQERDEPASVSYDGSRKMNNCFTHSFILGNSGESKSYDDDDEHCGTRVREREPLTICVIIDDQARGGRGKRR
jgi:hypothetical protein